MEKIFKKIEDNIFENDSIQEILPDNKSKNLSDDSTEDLSKQTKIGKIQPKSETKNNQNLNFFEKNNEDEEENIDEDEYADYGRIDKTGIHFQIISDYNVSIEIVPDELLRKDVKDLILKYKGVYDTTMNLWLIPYVNYELLYKELYKIEGINTKLHKVGSIAKLCYENKELTTLVIKRKKKEEKIDYLNDDNTKRKVEQLPRTLKNALYDFQVEGVKFGIEHHCRFLLADEMGVGKTIQAISLAYLYRDSWPVLIICPGSMKYLWKGEIQTWLGLKDIRINIINSSKQKISTEAYFYIISYDLVRNILKKLRRMTFDFVILDEAHSIKNKDSLRARNILPIAIRAKRLILMTGTPLLAKPYEGYPLLYALRPDLFPYFKRYAYRYCDPQPTPFGISWSGTSNTKELHWILSTLMVRRLKKDVLNRLPPKHRQKVLINTDPEVISQIKETRTKIKGRTGTLEAYTLTAKAKKNGVCEYISDILEAEEKIIVFAYHHEMLNSIESLIKRKKIDYIRIDGSTKQDKRYEYVTYFQKKKSCQVALLSIVAASTGITLNSAHIVIFAELTWTPSIMIQAEDRVHRIGQKSQYVDIKYLYGRETLDDFILDKLQKKLVIVSTTIDDKKENFGVRANPQLIHPEGKNSQELIKIAKGEINLSDIESATDNEDEEDLEKIIEKKMLNNINIDLEDLKDNNKNENDNDNINDKKITNLISNNNSENNNKELQIKKIRYPKDNEEIDLHNDYIKNNNQKSNINTNKKKFNDIYNNINELKKNRKKLPNTDTKPNQNINNDINDININNTNIRQNKKIKYPKDNNIKINISNIINDAIIDNNNKLEEKKEKNNNLSDIDTNSNILRNKKIKYPKNDYFIDDDDDTDSNKIKKNNKIKYPKREKTPSASDEKSYKHKLDKLKKNINSINRPKSADKYKKNKTSINDNSNEKNYLQEKTNDNKIDTDEETDKEKILDKSEIYKNYEKNLSTNLHKVNMRRTISNEETKHAQNIFDLNDNMNDNFISEKKIFYPKNNNFFY